MRVPHGLLSDSGRDYLTFDKRLALGAAIAARYLQHPVMPIFVSQLETQGPCPVGPAGSTSQACESLGEYRTGAIATLRRMRSFDFRQLERGTPNAKVVTEINQRGKRETRRVETVELTLKPLS